MNTSRTEFLAMVAALAGASTVTAADEHVYEMRTYTTLPGRLPNLIARFGDHTIKLFEKHGMKNIGYWTPVEAPASENTLIYILEHKDMEAAKASWAAFRADPAWTSAREASEKDGKIVDKVVSVYMKPTAFSKLK